MSDDFSDLENELRSLRLRRPSRELRVRIARDLNPGAPRSRSGFSFPALLHWALPVGAAASIAFLAVLRYGEATPPAALRSDRQNPPAQASTPLQSLEPEGAQEMLIALSRGDISRLPDGTLVQPVRKVSVDRYTWKDPRSKATLTWSLPREEFQIVPVVLH